MSASSTPYDADNHTTMPPDLAASNTTTTPLPFTLADYDGLDP
eukprot:CAMPEP_0198343488 /NCGR_PEP_ID=MMETSP1450-20131203/60556_1 /TAXON_ID=753684 ORGANISM="Madagascaria erythrocladiodes, Strain CCMP3234" /NCGR_SAMPLE_ID=MMETSP1450 /ASSEMBLY_ACC=CAM_ASM_001115 /LENGTH=42 /DNA_ID= /DNA_START= /DNA_END= /DNA_ORIENTATION=